MTTTFKYPPEAANGKLLVSEGTEATKEAIVQAVQTKYGERVFRSSYGNDIDEFTVIQDLEETLGELRTAIADSTAEYRPLSLSVTGEIGDDGRLDVLILFDDESRVQTLTIRI